MGIRYIKAKVVRSEMHTIIRDFPEWEIPILEAMHQSVEKLGEIVVNRDAPNADEEYDRLERRYSRSENEDGSRGIAYVATIYGQHGAGRIALRREIEKAVTQDAPPDGSDLLGLATV